MLSPKHPLFSSELFASGYVQKFRGKAITGTFRCPRTGMLASGIPTFLVTAARLEQLCADFQVMKNDLRDMINCHHSELARQLEKTPEALVETLRQHFQIEGVLPVSRTDFSEFSKVLERAMEARFQRLQESFENSRSTSSSLPPPCTPHQPCSTTNFKTWTWGGRIHIVPEGFQLPRPSVKAFFMLWHFGNIDTAVGPLKFLSKYDVTKADWVQVSRARGVIAEIERTARELGLVGTTTSFSQLDRAACGDIFDKAFERMVRDLYGDRGGMREGDKAIATLYRLILQKKK